MIRMGKSSVWMIIIASAMTRMSPALTGYQKATLITKGKHACVALIVNNSSIQQANVTRVWMVKKCSIKVYDGAILSDSYNW